ncbi:MAG: DUF3800 domain-containing protein [Anaerolineaceae bacterium]|nr:DUF3800 domain-containing protein [Anaerolineaceae bacterium]
MSDTDLLKKELADNFLALWSNPDSEDDNVLEGWFSSSTNDTINGFSEMLSKFLALREPNNEKCEFIRISTKVGFPRRGKTETEWLVVIRNEVRTEKDKRELLFHLREGTTNTLRDKVAYILNRDEDTRNSDSILQWRYWEHFEGELFKGGSFSLEEYLKLTSSRSIARERARIQNQYKILLADPEIRKKRGTLKEDERLLALEDKPGEPTISVFIDESGKNTGILLTGTVWFLADARPLHRKLMKFQAAKGIKEFHFKDLDERNIADYKEMVNVFLDSASTVRFQLNAVDYTGSHRKDYEILEDLHFHSIVQGLEYEFASLRVAPPRSLLAFFDAQGSKLDNALKANLEERFNTAAIPKFDGRLTRFSVHVFDSKSTLFFQVADLLVSCANRIIAPPTGSGRAGVKDEFSNWLLGRMNMDVSKIKSELLQHPIWTSIHPSSIETQVIEENFGETDHAETRNGEL